MSAFAPVASEARRRSKSTRCANRDRMHRSKQHRYSINSSARSKNDSGIVRPSALAAFRLITNSYLVGFLARCRGDGTVDVSAVAYARQGHAHVQGGGGSLDGVRDTDLS